MIELFNPQYAHSQSFRTRPNMNANLPARVGPQFWCGWITLGASMAIAAGVPIAAKAESPQLVATPENRLELRVGDQAILAHREGLWSVATNWTDNWPAGWVHAHPARVWREGSWTRASGHLELPEGRLELRMPIGSKGLVRGVRRFTWRGKGTAARTLSIRWIAPGAVHAKPMMPGILIYGNPAGARTGNTPSPFTPATRATRPSSRSIASPPRGRASSGRMVIPPAPRRCTPCLRRSPAAKPDQWWTLGVISRDDTELACSRARPPPTAATA